MIFADELVVVTHRPLTEGRPVPGYLFVETRRHAPTLADLTDAEASAVGWAVRRAAYALRRELSPEFVFSAVAGRSVTHFHQHVFARADGMPETLHWFDVDSWPDGPRIDASALRLLTGRLATYFTGRE
ncbi:HIT family protein [Nocardia amamiensis]|uniref:HIT family protein n=1 Tax=Nocardia amamiensis TaxID=404578 RepID=UPI000B250CCE|nr:HIT domain-containing protein [Nocardia amamiensis]